MYIAQHLLPVIRLVIDDHPVEHVNQFVGNSADRLDLLQRVTLPGREILVDLLEIRVALDQAPCCLDQDRPQPFASSPAEFALPIVPAYFTICLGSVNRRMSPASARKPATVTIPTP